MASKQQQRKQKAREKQRKRERSQAKTNRARRAARGGRASLTTAAGWPIGECYIGGNWADRGVRLPAIFTRVKGGRIAAAIFDVDLAAQGVVQAMARPDLSPDQFEELVAQVSATSMIIQTEPERIVKLIDVATTLRESSGLGATPGLGDALKLFGDLDAAACEDEFHTGVPDMPGVPGGLGAPPANPGLFTSMLQKLGLKS